MKEHTVSLIIAVGNGSDRFAEVIDGINRQTMLPDEVIIIADRVRDDSLLPLKNLEVKHELLRTSVQTGRFGVAAARNLGAEHSGSELLFFIDTDVILPEDCVERLTGSMGDADAVIGIQGLDCGFINFTSRYKNWWMRYTYERLAGKDAGVFNTGCGAIFRDCFFKAGGFEENYRRPNVDGVEDSAFGNRLLEYGFKVLVRKDWEFVHRKRYTVLSLLKTDYYRSKGLTVITLDKYQKLRGGGKPITSVPLSYFIAIPFGCFFWLSLPLLFVNRHFGVISLVCLGVSEIATSDFLVYLKQKGKISFMLQAVFFQTLVFAVSGMGILAGMSRLLRNRLRNQAAGPTVAKRC